jgi:delta24(24(1))-sterol reductase
MMFIFPTLLWYLWTCLTQFEGTLQYPKSLQDTPSWLASFVQVVREHAAPTKEAAAIYLGFMAFQLALALVMPGYQQQGLPVPSLKGKKLMYNCNGLGTFYTTVVTAATLQYLGIFDMAVLIDQFGPIMSVAMLTSFVIAGVCYFATILFGRPIRMSGNFIYDYFSMLCRPLGNNLCSP